MGTRNKMVDLNNHLFEQLERLNDEELSQEQLEKEVSRSKAMTDVSQNIIENAKLALDVAKFKDSVGMYSEELPTLLEDRRD